MLRLSQAKGSQRGGLSPGTLGIGTLVGSQRSAWPTQNLASSGRVWDRTWDCAWDPAAASEGGREAGLPSPATEPGLCNLVAKLFLQDASRRAREGEPPSRHHPALFIATAMAGALCQLYSGGI